MKPLKKIWLFIISISLLLSGTAGAQQKDTIVQFSQDTNPSIVNKNLTSTEDSIPNKQVGPIALNDSPTNPPATAPLSQTTESTQNLVQSQVSDIKTPLIFYTTKTIEQMQNVAPNLIPIAPTPANTPTMFIKPIQVQNDTQNDASNGLIQAPIPIAPTLQNTITAQNDTQNDASKGPIQAPMPIAPTLQNTITANNDTQNDASKGPIQAPMPIAPTLQNTITANNDTQNDASKGPIQAPMPIAPTIENTITAQNDTQNDASKGPIQAPIPIAPTIENTITAQNVTQNDASKGPIQAPRPIASTIQNTTTAQNDTPLQPGMTILASAAEQSVYYKIVALPYNASFVPKYPTNTTTIIQPVQIAPIQSTSTKAPTTSTTSSTTTWTTSSITTIKPTQIPAPSTKAPTTPTIKPTTSSDTKTNPKLLQNEENISEDFINGGPNLFTVTNTDVGFNWEKLPYREKYQWSNPDAPCRSFSLKVPDEKAEKSKLELCIYRPYLEFMDDTELFIHYVGGPNAIQEQKDLKVYGFVKGQNGSTSVYGKIVDRYFYGEVSIPDQETGMDIVYVVERILILTKLMRYNEKILRNILNVMENGITPLAKYNAVVTKGASLMNFMVSVNPTEDVLGSFLVFSTNHNSYITAGEPQMEMDERGKISFNAGGDKIVIDPIGTVNLITRSRKYIFRPHGKTVVQEGISVDTLQEHEGSVAVSAFTADSSYGCILPTPALSQDKKGGYVCKVCLAVDKSFLQYFKSEYLNNGSPMSLLGEIIDRASWIFRSTDWNDDTHSDNVGMDYDPQYELWTYESDQDNEETVTSEQLERIFDSLSKIDFSDCCLGIAFTMKNFPDYMRAISSRAKSPSLGGICAVRTNGDYNNLILISGNNKIGYFTPMTEEQLAYLTAHEIAKAFGADPDGTGEEACDQFTLGKQIGHYIMWPDVMRNASIEEKSFSSCTKKSILTALTTCKSACFDIDKHPFCGNGIVEDGEECDCGSEYQCSIQKCCYPRNQKHPCMKTGLNCKTSSSSSSAISFRTRNYSQFTLLFVVLSLFFSLQILIV